jgi:hypothetical protein
VSFGIEGNPLCLWRGIVERREMRVEQINDHLLTATTELRSRRTNGDVCYNSASTPTLRETANTSPGSPRSPNLRKTTTITVSALCAAGSHLPVTPRVVKNVEVKPPTAGPQRHLDRQDDRECKPAKEHGCSHRLKRVSLRTFLQVR